MLVQFDCYECIFKQIVSLARSVGKEDEARVDLLQDFLGFVHREAVNSTPPEMAAYFYEIYNGRTGNPDPYRREKDRSTQIGLELMPEFEAMIPAAPDPFLCMLKVVIGGNLIDYGTNPDFDLNTAAEKIRAVTALPLDTAMAESLRRRMEKAGRILYILDNCGEAVFDRFLLEKIRDKVTVAVRGKAILNDVTRREIAASGLEGFPVIDTGDGAPGVSLRRCSAEFLDALRGADLVIAKGQGNFESMEGQFTLRPVFFLFRAKCPVIQRYLHAEPGSLQIVGRNLQSAR